MTTLKEEEPYAAVVDAKFLSSTCSNCFAWNFDDPKRGKLSPCPGCQKLYYCSETCEKADLEDHKAECERFESAKFVPSENARLVMRMMEKSRRQPEFKSIGGHTYFTLDDNYEKLCENAHCMAEAGSVYSEIKRFMGPNAPNLDDVFRAYSKMTINSFVISDGSWDHTPRGVGLYLDLSFLKHSCRPDAFVVSQGTKMVLRTTKEDCKYSDKLTISYIEAEFFRDTEDRQDDLQKYFSLDCKCEECEDVESNEKRTSGRPDCCPHSWFSVSDHPVCNNCDKGISHLLKDKAEDAMEGVKGAISVLTTIENVESAVSAMVPQWMSLLKSCEKVLSDENRYLFHIRRIISRNVLPLTSACGYADSLIPLARESPHNVCRTILLISRHQYYEWAEKPLQETKEALDEAIDAAQVVFGPKHELTQSLIKKKMKRLILWLLRKMMFFNFMNLFIDY